jgi:hypothetical protein
LTLLLAFYVDAIRDDFEPVDNDGDSADWDNDGYPLGQENKYGTSDWDGQEYPGSGYYVMTGEIDWNDDSRSHSGNHTWDGQGYLDADWVDLDYTGSRWSGLIDWGEANPCPEGDVFDDWWLDWGEACTYDDGSYFVSGKFRASGLVSVPDGHYMEWGHMTLAFYVEAVGDTYQSGCPELARNEVRTVVIGAGLAPVEPPVIEHIALWAGVRLTPVDESGPSTASVVKIYPIGIEIALSVPSVISTVRSRIVVPVNLSGHDVVS